MTPAVRRARDPFFGFRALFLLTLMSVSTAASADEWSVPNVPFAEEPPAHCAPYRPSLIRPPGELSEWLEELPSEDEEDYLYFVPEEEFEGPEGLEDEGFDPLEEEPLEAHFI